MIEMSVGSIDLSSVQLISDTKDSLHGMFDNKDIVDGQNIEIPPNFKAAITVSRLRKTGELSWANAVMSSGVIGLEYDYNYHNVAFQEDPQERIDEPYRAVIGIESKKKVFAGKTIWYDQAGKATVIRTDSFDRTHLRTNLKRQSDNTWQLLYFGDNEHWKAKIIQQEADHLLDAFGVGIIRPGETVIVDEYSYCLQIEGNTIKLVSGPVLKPDAFVLAAPFSINIEEFSNMLLVIIGHK